MRHRNVLKTILMTGAVALLGLGMAQNAARAQLLFGPQDWLLHRGTPDRVGANGDPGLPPGTHLAPVWVYPSSGDMLPEIVADNTKPAEPAPPIETDTGQRFAVQPAAPWTYTALADRSGSAWPAQAPATADLDATHPKAGDYWYALAQTSAKLNAIEYDPNTGASTGVLEQLPNLGETFDPVTASNTYKTINDELDETKNAGLVYARWSFGDRYPVGTVQGTNTISTAAAANSGNKPNARPITPNQRYAVFINYPPSGTFIGGVGHPNVTHAMVRVSWGQNVNDPVTSRIFMIDLSGTGGWVRVRSGADDDRYFPYAPDKNGQLWPIQVTLYTSTPDDVTNTNLYGTAPIVPADAVRLVPESLRGQIHAPAVSAHFTLPNNELDQLTYYGRDETTGPVYVNDVNKLKATPYDFSGFTLTPFDPTLPPQTDPNKASYNPLIGDPTSSVRSAVFYCIQDKLTGANAPQYGKLLWRYPARTSVKNTVTVDNSDGVPAFSSTGAFAPGPGAGPNGNAQQYGNDYLLAQVTDPTANNASTATWQAGLPDTAQGSSWSVYAWIPADVIGNPNSRFAHQATYNITTDSGTITVRLDQRNTPDPNPLNPNLPPRAGMWRRIASGIRFPAGNFNGTAYNAVGTVQLTTDSAQDFADDPARVVAADAIQFVSESRSSNSVVAAPLLADVRWPSGTLRKVVYFATTDGHVWALDALGPLNQPAANVQATTTSTYWVYPSVSNPNPATPQPNGFGPQVDPNLLPDASNNVPGKGIDGDIVQTTINGQPVYTPANLTPNLGAFRSSPVLVNENPTGTDRQYVVLGNDNGRLYAFDAVGRVNTDPMVGPVNEPYPVTFAAGDNPGVPGTTRRVLTWPTTARDKYLRDQASKAFSTYTDDPGKAAIDASPAVPTNALAPNYTIVGTAEGHVYAVWLMPGKLTPSERISNSLKGQAADGTPMWQYPSTLTQLDPIDEPGAWALDATSNAALYVFSAGGRIYAIRDPQAASNTPPLEWTYPFTATPPGNPGANDVAAFDLPFSAPVLKAISSFNGGKLSAFVSNQDGNVYAFDASVTGNPAGNQPLWTALQPAASSASPVLLNYLQRQETTFFDTNTPSGPSLLLPLNGGGITGIEILPSLAAGGQLNVAGGATIWQEPEVGFGQAPITDASGNPAQETTFIASRGADASTANQFVFSGDEGNPATGEMNGQMNAYGNEAIGLVTPGQPPPPPPNTGQVTLRLADVFYSKNDAPPANVTYFWENFLQGAATPQSPYDAEIKGGQTRQPTTQVNGINVYVFEMGDSLHVAAWGTYQGGGVPGVTFYKESGGATTAIPALVHPDTALQDANAKSLLTADGSTPFTATAIIPIGIPSANDPNAPGTQSRISAQATLTINGANFTTPRIYLGQFEPLQANPSAPPPILPIDSNVAAQQVPRDVTAFANPLALTTSGLLSPAGQPNKIGWTNGVPVDNAGVSPAEIVLNGNMIARFDPNSRTFVPQTLKDLVAPLGLVSHGSSAAYVGVTANGGAAPALFVADRSNLWKTGQRLAVRVEPTDLNWTWNTDTTNQLTLRTGDVMNPLPWETFPNTVPNVSPDYPDIDRQHARFLVGQTNLALRSVNLPAATANNGTKTLNPTEIDLTVDVPRFQPANVNHHYFDINGFNNPLLLAPMDVATGMPVPARDPNLGKLNAPSAGYTGAFAVFVEPAGASQTFQGLAPRLSRGQRVNRAAGATTYRQLNVALAVPPDVNLRTEETTVDIGNVPHGLGYQPQFPFVPSYLFPYDGTVGGVGNAVISPWDTTQGPLAQGQFFRPFTVRNQGNVNAVDVRVAKVVADYTSDPTNPLFWSTLTSDQVQPQVLLPNANGTTTAYYTFNNPPLFGVRYQPYLAQSGPGQIGIVSSLDHTNSTATFSTFDIDPTYSAQKATGMWPYFVPNAVPSYVQPGNPLDGAGVGWDGVKAGQYNRPTIHKPRPGDSSGTTMSVPDVAWGDPQGLLTNLQAFDTSNNRPVRSTKPEVSIAIPIGTPAGTYSAPVYTFEDHQPEQWRQWVYFYRGLINDPDGSPFTVASAPQIGDDDGLLNVTLPNGNSSTDQRMMPEARSNPTFSLKVRVVESRLTNGSSPGAFAQVDNRGALPQFGANIQPAPYRDPITGNMTLIWPSNRHWNGSNWVDPGTTDAPWYLVYSQLGDLGAPQKNWPGLSFAAVGTPGVFYDWKYTSGNQWWTPVTPAQQYPTASVAVEQGLFPSQTSQLLPNADPNTPLVPGLIDQSLASVRHATPAVAFVDDAKMAVPPFGGPNPGGNPAETWMFWQGTVAKSASAAGAGSPQGFTYDTRTFYTLLKNGVPQDAATNPPYSFLNDPALPKFGPKPLLLKDKNGRLSAFLFWYGGGQDRTRLYYNVSGDPTTVRTWSQDTILPTPGSLQYQAEPTPIHRQIYSTWFNPAGEVLDVVDLVYEGVLPRKREPETLLTRYALQYDQKGNPFLQVMPIGVTDPAPNGQTPTPQTVWGAVDKELLAREGGAQVWSGRDLAWVYAANVADPNNAGQFRRQYTHFDPDTGDVRPFIKVYIFDKNGQSRSNRTDTLGNAAPVNLGGQPGDPAPIFDSATGHIIYASAMGGQIIVDPQAGTVTFDGIAPRPSDQVVVAYTPQTLRVNTTRNDSGLVAAPAGNNEAGLPWSTDPAYAPKPHVDAPGANTSPVAFIDRSPNPRFSSDPRLPTTVFPGSDPNQPATVSRMYVFYRKSGSSATASSSIYFKTMRLMIRLPRGVLRNADGTINNGSQNNLVVTGNLGPYEVDWVRGRVYFTEVDEGRRVTVTTDNYTRDSSGNPVSVPPAQYRVEWGDEMSVASAPGDATTSETIVPTQSVVNEGQVTAFKDFFQDKVWLFWSSTRNGTTDLYYMTISPQFYPQPAQ